MKFLIFPMSFYALKWRPTCYKMAPDESQNVPQCFLRKWFAGYLYL